MNYLIYFLNFNFYNSILFLFKIKKSINMNFELTEEQLAVKEAARDFAQNVLKPGVIDRDNQQRFYLR